MCATPEQDTEHTGSPRSWLATCWLRFTLAVTFLTRLPLPVTGNVHPEDLHASMGWYPLIGAGLGAAGFGLYLAGNLLFPRLLSASLAVVLLEMATGTLHLDGFMDTCDGIGSGRSRERMLEIMKDSRVGAMGVFGAVAVLLIKVAALAALAPAQSLVPLVAGWTAARAIPVVNVAGFRYARQSGTGGLFTGLPARVRDIALLLAFGAGSLVAGSAGCGLVLGCLLITLLVQRSIARQLGGLTGDVYGFGVELAELLALVGGSAMATWKFI